MNFGIILNMRDSKTGTFQQNQGLCLNTVCTGPLQWGSLCVTIQIIEFSNIAEK